MRDLLPCVRGPVVGPVARPGRRSVGRRNTCGYCLMAGTRGAPPRPHEALRHALSLDECARATSIPRRKAVSRYPHVAPRQI